MLDVNIMQWLDMAGVFVFAASGALTAATKKMDIFGFIVIALITAVGGGTLRDVVLDVPVFWLSQPIYVWITLSAAILTFLFTQAFHRGQIMFLWFDAIGLAVFCVLGAAKTYAITSDPFIAVMMGVVSAVVGGVIRDIICNDIPLIFHSEVYATAAFTGAMIFTALITMGTSQSLAMLFGFLAAFGLRSAGILWGWALPKSPGLK
ncbi:MAG: putative membrane protein YeiH [Flavobacterium sp.]|jgi:uncharacterized membrane protein YeiH